MNKLYLPFVLLLLASCASNEKIGSHSALVLEQMVPSNTGNIDDFYQHILYYLVEENIESVWAVYTEESLDKYWNGPIAKFSAMYSSESKIAYSAENSEIPAVSTGEIISLNLLFEGYIRIPVYFQIQRVDSEEKIIEFAYMEQNKSHGKQLISFFPVTVDGKNITLIRHKSWFHSDSTIRDLLFYSDYHTQTVDEFHQSATGIREYSIKPVTEKYLIRKGLIISPVER